MVELGQHECLPRLLDLDPPPPLSRQRWYWRYVHRWRMRLFQVWQRDDCGGVDDSVIGKAVDEIIGAALLIEHAPVAPQTQREKQRRDSPRMSVPETMT